MEWAEEDLSDVRLEHWQYKSQGGTVEDPVVMHSAGVPGGNGGGQSMPSREKGAATTRGQWKTCQERGK